MIKSGQLVSLQKQIILAFTVLLTHINIYAQYDYEPVFPDLKGDALYNKVKDAYRPNSVIDYAFARDTLFLKIDAVNRNLSCIYTNLTLPIPEGSDPTTAVFLNGNNNGINTEHAYPLSLGTENTNAQSDMHHLYPSRVKTNADRGNEPYSESNDNTTVKWYRDKEELTFKPSTNIDEYSEQGQGIFEPREKVKGDIARSIFYIYTIYRDEVKAVNSDFFEIQKSTLCNWHYTDPVDEKEWNRSHGIAKYQGNNNPFVLDCSLVARMYCNEVSSECKLLDTEDGVSHENEVIFDHENNLLLLYKKGQFTIMMFDVYGRQVKKYEVFNQTEGAALINMDVNQSGLFIINIQGQKYNYSKKIILNN
jgi:Endonuclease I